MIGEMKEERACNCRTASDSSLEVQPVLELIMNGWLHQAFFTTDRSLLGDIDSYLKIITKRVQTILEVVSSNFVAFRYI